MNFKSLDLNLLRVLNALLRQGSTVAAGREIGMSQPAVSAALGRLRHALNDPLFVRSGQGLEPTDFARSIATPLAEALEQLEHVLEPTSFDPSSSGDTFVVASSDLFAVMVMPRLARELAKVAPGVIVKMLELQAGSYVAELEAGKADIVLVPNRSLPDFVERQPLFDSPGVIVARAGNARLRAAGVKPGNEIALDLFCDLPQVLYSPSGDLNGIADVALSNIGRKRRIVMTLGTFGSVLQTVAESDLIAVLPQHFAENQARIFDLEIYDMPFGIPDAELVMGWHRRSTQNAAHKWFRTTIAELVMEFF